MASASQAGLAALAFSGAGEAALRDFCRSEAEALRHGERDGGGGRAD